MRAALCIVLCLLLVGCGAPEDTEQEILPPTPPLSEQADSYQLADVTVKSVGGYTGYVTVNDEQVEVHPYFDLTECLYIRVIYTSEQDWWEVATTDLPVTDIGTYQLIQNADGSVYGFMPIDDRHGLFVSSYDLPLGYVKLYMDRVWISDT